MKPSELIRFAKYIYGLSPHNFYGKDNKTLSLKVMNTISEMSKLFISKEKVAEEIEYIVNCNYKLRKRLERLIKELKEIK